MSSQDQPLSALAASLMEGDVSPSPMRSNMHAHHMHGESCHSNWWALVFYFLVFALVLYFVFYALRPSFVLEDDKYSHSSYESYGHGHKDREINNGKLLGSAIVGALLLIFVLWVFWWALQGSW